MPRKGRDGGRVGVRVRGDEVSLGTRTRNRIRRERRSSRTRTEMSRGGVRGPSVGLTGYRSRRWSGEWGRQRSRQLTDRRDPALGEIRRDTRTVPYTLPYLLDLCLNRLTRASHPPVGNLSVPPHTRNKVLPSTTNE